jgi:protein-tyrosine phosphatase/membrane-associated phospholipid phosphatase
MNESRPWRAAILWMVALGLFFFASYAFANWLAGQRGHVSSIVFAWEHRIPFLPWTIVPYWSIDLFYAISFFTCTTRQELDAHARSLLAAQLISVAVFLIFPLRFSFQQPQTTGLFGSMFHLLGSFDRPFNQAPSLHLSLLIILWAKFSQHMRGPLRSLLRIWFVLIAFSTLTTYQHHFIDLPTGVWVGLFCLMFFSAEKVTPRFALRGSSTTIGCLYLAGSVCLIAAGCRIGGAAWLLLWPAGSLLIVAIAYWAGSPHLLSKSIGTMRRTSIILLAPSLAGAWLNSRWWTRNSSPAQEIVPGVWLGRVPTRSERERLQIASLITLAPELLVNAEGVASRAVPMLDLVVPAGADLEAAVHAIDALKPKRPTLVCCALGYSRSAMAIAAWLIASQIAPSVDSAIGLLRGRRHRIVLGEAHRARLKEWAQSRGTL